MVAVGFHVVIACIARFSSLPWRADGTTGQVVGLGIDNTGIFMVILCRKLSSVSDIGREIRQY
jgi:hypothetical protein